MHATCILCVKRHQRTLQLRQIMTASSVTSPRPPDPCRPSPAAPARHPRSRSYPQHAQHSKEKNAPRCVCLGTSCCPPSAAVAAASTTTSEAAAGAWAGCESESEEQEAGVSSSQPASKKERNHSMTHSGVATEAPSSLTWTPGGGSPGGKNTLDSHAWDWIRRQMAGVQRRGPTCRDHHSMRCYTRRACKARVRAAFGRL